MHGRRAGRRYADTGRREVDACTAGGKPVAVEKTRRKRKHAEKG